VWHVWGQGRDIQDFGRGYLTAGDHCEGLGVDGVIILQYSWILNRSLGTSWSRSVWVRTHTIGRLLLMWE